MMRRVEVSNLRAKIIHVQFKESEREKESTLFEMV